MEDTDDGKLDSKQEKLENPFGVTGKKGKVSYIGELFEL